MQSHDKASSPIRINTGESGKRTTNPNRRSCQRLSSPATPMSRLSHPTSYMSSLMSPGTQYARRTPAFKTPVFANKPDQFKITRMLINNVQAQATKTPTVLTSPTWSKNYKDRRHPPHMFPKAEMVET